MRKGPEESATNFSVGKEKEGNDGNIWVIVKNKNGVKRWAKKNSLFVLYSFNNVESWEYKNIPKDWKWIGTGSAIGYPYEREEQFSGPPNSKKTQIYLNKFFANLKKKNVIKKYKIIQTYSQKKSATRATKSKRKKSKKSKTSKKVTGKKYFIFDNGGRPYKVVIKGKGLDIFTYNDENYDDYPVLVKSYRKLNKIFIPKGIDDRGKAWSGGKGNTILAHISGNRYLFIGPWIYEFETKDKIVEYHSQVGNSGVPYPLAVGEKNVYFLIAKGEDGYLSKEYFEEFPKKYSWAIDGYSRLWGQNIEKKLSTKKISKIKVIKKRTF